MNEHYKNISTKFNKVWKFSDDYKRWAIEKIGFYLKLNEKDILADIGGGTGTFAHLIKKKFMLNKVYCIEPEVNMCNIAKQYSDIEIICSDAFYFVNNLQYSYNKILFKEVIHHIKDRNSLWHDIYNSIDCHGRILIYTRPQNIKFPLFERAKEAFYKNQPSHKLIVSELKDNGFNVDVSIESFQFKLPKEEWHNMLKTQFMSDLSVFSDQEILEGIHEIENKYNTDFYDIEDEIVFISAYK